VGTPSAEGARIEAPRGEGVGRGCPPPVGRGCPPPHRGRGLARGPCPSPEKF